MYHKTVLDNGLRLITSSMPYTHSVCVAMFIGTGSCYETEAEAGISHFIEHLCFKGTERRPTSKEISEAIEGVGGILNGGTDKELTTFWCKVASPHFPIALDVLVDLLRHSRFDAKDIERERQIITEEINMCLDLPQHRVDILIDELLWPGQPLGRDVAGSKETVAALTRDQMLNNMACHYLPNNTVVSIAGDIHHEQVMSSLEAAFADWKSGQLQVGYPSDDNQVAPRLRIEQRDTEQAHLCLAVHGIPILHPDRFAVDLLNVILGEGMSSRLFVEIRERRGLAYEIHSYASHFLNSGSVIIYAGVDPAQVDTAVAAILEELSRLKHEIPENEVHKAKELAKGRLLLRMEDSRAVTGWLGAQELLARRILTVDDIIAIVDAITPEDIKRVAQQLLVTEQLNLAVVGPVQKEEQLASLLKL